MSGGGRANYHMITVGDDGRSCSSKKRRRMEEITSASASASASSSSYPRLPLPHDVICVILSKLPVKSILRFRSVCKSWEHLISQPYFIELQLLEARKSPPRILVVTNHDPYGTPASKFRGSMRLFSFKEEEASEPEPLVAPKPLVEFSIERDHEAKTSVCQYDCDGLVLLISQETIWACNPGTRETLFVPYDYSDNMPIDDNVYQHIGFGLDPTTNSYKIVRMFYRSFSLDDEFEIYEESVLLKQHILHRQTVGYCTG
ncbi:putative F-box protein [Iris pallida]|uniref:F-box protein n=1 Tax=Iris pallida TaxID=29817 RepID=A0AAX6G7L1_IRIPA|nr:putative F-box protein [Iris pallida]